jgi:hypothetical protein
VQPVDLSSLGERVGPAGPRKPFGKRLLEHTVVQAEVAHLRASFDPADEQSHKRPGRERHQPQKPVERVVAAARQKPGDACLRLTPVQEDQADYVERDQCGGGRAAYPLDAEAAQYEDDPLGERARGSVQARRHGKTSAGQEELLGRSASYPTVASPDFQADRSSHRVSPVTKPTPAP